MQEGLMTMSDGDHDTETEQQENQTEAPFLIPGARNPRPLQAHHCRHVTQLETKTVTKVE